MKITNQLKKILLIINILLVVIPICALVLIINLGKLVDSMMPTPYTSEDYVVIFFFSFSTIALGMLSSGGLLAAIRMIIIEKLKK